MRGALESSRPNLNLRPRSTNAASAKPRLILAQWCGKEFPDHAVRYPLDGQKRTDADRLGVIRPPRHRSPTCSRRRLTGPAPCLPPTVLKRPQNGQTDQPSNPSKNRAASPRIAACFPPSIAAQLRSGSAIRGFPANRSACRATKSQ